MPFVYQIDTTIPTSQIKYNTITTNIQENMNIPTSKIQTSVISTNINEKATSKLNEDTTSLPIEIEESTEIITNVSTILDHMFCNTIDFLHKLCGIKENNIKAKINMINQIKNDIANGIIKSMLENVTNKEKQDIIVEDSNVIYQITSSDNQNNKKYLNISTLKLGECENKLKEKYNISIYEPLLIFKADVYETGLLMPIIEYEVFHPFTLKKLELDICIGLKIQIAVPVTINENEIYKHDPNSDYYNDKCYPAISKDGTDIILSDRKEEFLNNNLTLCENNCNFKEYNTETKQAICDCLVKQEIDLLSDIIIDRDQLLSYFSDYELFMNIDVIKCYKILFTKEGIIFNIGSYVLLFSILIYFITLIMFVAKDFSLLQKHIKDIVRFKEYSVSNYNTKRGSTKFFKNNITITKIKKNHTIETILNKKKKQNQQIKQHNQKKQSNQNKKNKHNQKIKQNKQNKTHKNKKHPPLKKKKERKSLFDSSENSIIKKSLNKRSLTKEELFKKRMSNKNVLKSYKKQISSKDNIKKRFVPKFNDYEMNNFTYNEAFQNDKRSYCDYYLSLLRTKHIIIFTFYLSNDYNSKIIKIYLLFFSFDLYYTVSALFYTCSVIHDIYKDSGNFILMYHLPQIFYSTTISAFINMLIKTLSLSQKKIIEVKQDKNKKNKNKIIMDALKCLKIKFTFFFLLSFLLSILFWYYLACFCAVYKNTQIHLIKDTLLSFLMSLLYPFGLNLLPGLFRIPAIKDSNKNRIILYKISEVVQLI